jgi:hypothetical protein
MGAEQPTGRRGGPQPAAVRVDDGHHRRIGGTEWFDGGEDDPGAIREPGRLDGAGLAGSPAPSVPTIRMPEPPSIGPS